MQKLVYVPPWSEYGGIDDVTLELSAPYILGTISGTGGADIDITSRPLPGFSGEFVENVRVESRVIACTIHVEGATREEMYRQRFNLSQLMRVSETPGYIYYSNDYITLRTQAIPQKSPDFTARVQNYNKAEIKFYCPSPYWEAVEEASGNVGYVDGGFEFTLEIGQENGIIFGTLLPYAFFENSGVLDAPVRIEISGPATNPTIQNTTTGEKIVLDREVLFGETLVINTQRGNVYVKIIHENGSSEDAFHYITPDSEFWQLAPGRNQIDYYTDNESEPTEIKISYRQLYAGA